jgi:threonine aldolase
VSYGDDPWTARASDLIRDLFETACEVFFVFNGTAANSLALAASGQSYHSVLCHELAHVETDECGAPEFFSNGMKVLQVSGRNGKLDPAGIERLVRKRSDIHYPKPRAVSITQATEVGTVYRVDEIKAIWAKTKQFRLPCTWTARGSPMPSRRWASKPKEITWQAGVDVLCFGGTKNGTPVGDAVVFFNRELAQEFDYRCKQSGQLCSKMRFLAAPWVGMLKDGAWLRHAAQANAMARRLHDALPFARGQDPVPDPGERRLCRPAALRDPCIAAGGLEVLHLHRRWGLPAHVRLGHAREDVDQQLGVRIDLDPSEAGEWLRETSIRLLLRTQVPPGIPGNCPGAKTVCRARPAHDLQLSGAAVEPNPTHRPVDRRAPAGIVRTDRTGAAIDWSPRVAWWWPEPCRRSVGPRRPPPTHGWTNCRRWARRPSPSSIKSAAFTFRLLSPRIWELDRFNSATWRAAIPRPTPGSSAGSRGRDRGPRREAVLLNAAAALLVAGLVKSLVEGWERAEQIIDEGSAHSKLDQLVSASRTRA